MIEIKITWHFILFVGILVMLLVWALTRDCSDDGWGIKTAIVWGFYTAVTLLVIAIYGGIFWW